ncbi:leucine-rich repeat transmembrane protein FLRT2 [Engraulis encrasicolus]|uniref:leucine-rich repeat transmembrane protein FLRT2 n=1 Tax=Engraulis encrasicolus TaxID=184585 RepID=UPI002FD29CBD
MSEGDSQSLSLSLSTRHRHSHGLVTKGTAESAVAAKDAPMELQAQSWSWNKDLAAFIRPWIPIMLGLHLQFSCTASTSCPDECRCDRTFVYCNERSLTSVPLGIGEGYDILYLHNNQINNAGFPLELHHVKSVETVYLYGNQLDEFPINLPKKVRVLHLQENNIQTISRAALAQLQWLEELYLDDNSISTVGVEEGAFREAASLKYLFLTKNHLSSVPIGLPPDLKELRLDENRIAVIAEEAFENVTALESLLLDGNLLTDEGIDPLAFRGLVNLRTLSLARNSLTAPPSHLPAECLEKLNLQDNQLNEIPVGVLSGLHRLEKLDLSSNQLQQLTQGVFDGLLSLRQLTVRNNLWHCDCGIKWVTLWLKVLPASLNVRGFMCQTPEGFRGMAIRELSLELVQCPPGTASVVSPTGIGTSASAPASSAGLTHSSHSVPRSPPLQGSLSPTLRGEAERSNPNLNATFAVENSGQEPLLVSLTAVNHTCIQVSWLATFDVTAYKVTLVRMGERVVNERTQETMVPGELGGVSLANLEPDSAYHVCVAPLDASNSHYPGRYTVCSEVTTMSLPVGSESTAAVGPEQATQRDLSSPFLLAGLIGGGLGLVLILALPLGLLCWHTRRKGTGSGSSSSTSPKWKYSRGRRKDDYCEAGTKKDNSILEMTETSFQLVSLNNEQLLKGPFHIQPIYAANGSVAGPRQSSNGSGKSSTAQHHNKTNHGPPPNSNVCHTK